MKLFEEQHAWMLHHAHADEIIYDAQYNPSAVYYSPFRKVFLSDQPVRVAVPHRCQYNHMWSVSLPEGVYDMPQKRFCLKCLEWERIEVASIQLVRTYSACMEYTCTVCQKRTLFPLRPDWHMDDVMVLGDRFEEQFVEKLRWFHLPLHWPTICKHQLRELP